ncbi:MAG: hypothetical protein WKF87_11240 [Chryseolinea sp.]
MWGEILKAIPVYLSSMIKFIFGPVGGYLAGLSFGMTVFVTVAGMMTVVFLFSFFGEFMRTQIVNRFFSNKKRFTPRNRKFVTIWKKYGLVGVAALTPVLLTPIGGSILAVSCGAPRNKLLLYMFISAVTWALIFSGATFALGREFLSEYF